MSALRRRLWCLVVGHVLRVAFFPHDDQPPYLATLVCKRCGRDAGRGVLR